MTSTQRIIKYLALAFALFLIVTILTTISKVGKAIVSHTKSDSDKKIEDVYIWTEETIINDLNIDVAAFNIEIKTGDSFRVESSKKNIKCYVEDNILKISEKEHLGVLRLYVGTGSVKGEQGADRNYRRDPVNDRCPCGRRICSGKEKYQLKVPRIGKPADHQSS